MMKKGLILILLTVAISAVCTKVKAQSPAKIALSLGPELGVPINAHDADGDNVRNYYGDGIGGSLKLELPVIDGLDVTVTAGYMDYKSTRYLTYSGPYLEGSSITNTPNYTYIPLKAGLRYYLNKYLYVESNAGEAIKTSVSASSSFIYGGSMGGIIPINAHNSVDIGVAVERGYKNVYYSYPMGQVAFRLAYRYNF
jgi:hypothetical protein